MSAKVPSIQWRLSFVRLALIGPVYPYRGGIAHYTTGLYRALQKRRHEVLLISFRRQYPQWLFPGQSDKDPSQEPLQAEQARYWIDSLNPFTWLATFRRIYAYRPDMILQQWWVTFWAPAWFVLGTLNRWFLKRPMLIVCHNVLPHETRRWDRWLARLALRQGTVFIVQSVQEKDQLRELVPEAKVQIFPLPTFDMFADQQMPRSQARQQLGLAQDLPVLLFFGMVREYKGLADLLEALPAVKESLGQVLLVVAGEFWDNKQPYLDAIQQLGIEDSVLIDDRYIPNEEAGVYFSAADALVAPYRRVTGSAVIPTARAFRLPVVTTQLPGLAQVVDSQSDRLVPPCEPDALAAAITEFFAGETRSGQSEHLRRKAFTWDQLVTVIEAIAQADRS
jgi:glycosyltransferase involved in cell wall biosynthesis